MILVKIYKICPICGNDLPYWQKNSTIKKCKFCKGRFKESEIIIERRVERD